MTPAQLVRRKREGEELSPDDVRSFLTEYGAGRVADYQMAAFLMAVFFRGMTTSELTALVDVMIGSGAVADLSSVAGIKVDKHSTGGVGDKVSIVLAPLVASLGVPVPMMSGRGLGHTGGTVDKLETIPGFRTDLSLAEYRSQMERLGCALIAQTDEIAPLDRRLYALRDVTATVESIPLIASSIMSKKLAEGIDALVLDVKVGNGAFIPHAVHALELARTMVGIGEAHGKRMVALLTAMDRPLGHAVGNALEIEECVLALRGEGPADLRDLTIALAAEMLVLGGAAPDVPAARTAAAAALDDGRALRMLGAIIEAQGGNSAVLEDPAILPQAPVRRVVTASSTGTVLGMDVRAIGEAAVALGAGRRLMDDAVDPAVGLHLTVKTGDRVARGQALGTVYARSEAMAETAARSVLAALTVGDGPAQPLPLVVDRVTGQGRVA
ncbi:MAG TPA: thymidine phosphorylase [Longimicrobiales bacterium]|nr:thymidine phosphorylase [Longimicrobiales bacterium]